MTIRWHRLFAPWSALITVTSGHRLRATIQSLLRAQQEAALHELATEACTKRNENPYDDAGNIVPCCEGLVVCEGKTFEQVLGVRAKCWSLCPEAVHTPIDGAKLGLKVAGHDKASGTDKASAKRKRAPPKHKDKGKSPKRKEKKAKAKRASRAKVARRARKPHRAASPAPAPVPREGSSGTAHTTWLVQGKEAQHLTYLIRYLSDEQERTFPLMWAKIQSVTKRVDGKMRLATPFEAVCGGDQLTLNLRSGADGPTQYDHFTNANVRYRSHNMECHEKWDKGQRRVWVHADVLQEHGALIFDMSTTATAYKWCYEGGCQYTKSGHKVCFQGAKDHKPWNYKCAHMAYGKMGAVPDSWWTTENRKKIAKQCATWATNTAEVLILPNPDVLMTPNTHAKFKVMNDRSPLPVANQCTNSITDHCLSFDTKQGIAKCFER